MSLNGTTEWSLSPRESTNDLGEPEVLHTEQDAIHLLVIQVRF